MTENPTPLPPLILPRNCGNCRFGAIGNPSDMMNSRLCRRFPPVSLLAPAPPPANVHLATVWPEVRVKDVCGEHKFVGEGVEGAASQAN